MTLTVTLDLSIFDEEYIQSVIEDEKLPDDVRLAFLEEKQERFTEEMEELW